MNDIMKRDEKKSLTSSSSTVAQYRNQYKLAI